MNAGEPKAGLAFVGVLGVVEHVYRCGCYWTWSRFFGDLLSTCDAHRPDVERSVRLYRARRSWRRRRRG